MSKDKFEVEDPKAIITAWLEESKPDVGKTSPPSSYITPEGMAYLNGFLQTNRTISLIKQERYDDLINDYENLIKKYEQVKKENIKLKSNKVYKILRYIF